MTPEQLRNSILQMAIEGKLTEQRPEDGNAADLLKEIKAEKAKLVKDGVIKKEKPLPEIAEDEIPFEVPENWAFVKLGNITSKIGAGSTPSGGKAIYKQSGVKFLRSQNIYNDGLNMTGLVYISEEINKSKQGSVVQAKDILLNITGGSIGRCAIVPDDFDLANINQHILIIRNINEHCRKFIHYVLISPYIQRMIMDVQVGVSREGLSADKTKNFVMPFPPLAEQMRIVDRLEKILPLIDDYEKAYNELHELNKAFPGKLKNSLLQMAVQGKLTEQRPEDGNAADLLKEIQAEKAKLVKEGKIKKEKPLPEISEDEIPFEIPKNWCWCRLGNVGAFERGSGIKREQTLSSGYPCVRYGELYTTYKGVFAKTKSFTSEEVYCSSHKGNYNDIFMALTGENKVDIATAVVYQGEEQIAYGGDMTKFSHLSMDSLYLMYMLNSPFVGEQKKILATGNIIVHISNDKLATMMIPLPPLAEQKRIVAKLEQLLPLCDTLAKAQQ